MNAPHWLVRTGFGLLFAMALATVAHAQAPVIIVDPVSRSATIGGTATFSVTATGTAPLTYQWSKNHVNIPGANAASYTTPPVVIGDNFSVYRVLVTNSAGSDLSNLASLSVNDPLDVDVSGPGGVAAGQTATFTANINGGTPPYTYQWYKNGTAPANLIPGATASTYTTPVLTLADDQSTYFVRITDASNVVTTSTGEALTVFIVVQPQTITFVAPVNPVVSPTPLALNATASSGLPVTFAVLSGPATVSGINLTLSGVGTVTVRATQAGNVNFDPAPAVERTFAVGKGTPEITWNLPAVVGDGTILGPAQLNATANVPGTFAYDPASGTVVRTGVQVMRATFTPASTTNYNSVTITRFLNISGAPVVTGPTGVAAGQTATFSVVANFGVPPHTFQWFRNGEAPANIITGATGTSYTTPPTTVAADNSSTYTVKITDGNGVTVTAIPLQLTVRKADPQITWNPGPAFAGTTLGPSHLNATASVPGVFAYNPALGAVINAPAQTVAVTFTPADTANFNTVSAQRTLTVGAATDLARLTNVSVRTTMAAAQTLIVGFTMQGGEKPVLIRAVGPGLVPLNVTGAMNNPTMSLFRDTTLLDANDNWGGGAALTSAFVAVGAFPLPPASLDAALLRSIDGGRTAQITGGAGIVVVEMYDAGTGDSPRLTNVSARNFAGRGDDILIAGFTIGGSGQRNLLIRGVGPTLAELNVTGVLLTNPKLEVFNGSGAKISENDTWDVSLAGTFAGVGAFPLTLGSNDAALTISLPAGGYTVQVSGADGGTGEALVEIYELP